eukprot:scaffold115760_cov65-Attheya_sp.AAC.1
MKGRDSDTGESGTRMTNLQAGTKRADRAGAAGSRKRHHYKKVVVLDSMLGPSVLFNMGYRHGANGDRKEPGYVGIVD